jgi:hypothetical protein
MFAIQRVLFATTLAALIPSCAMTAQAQEMPVEGPVTTTALINVQSKADTALNPAMLTLQVNGHATPVLGVKPIGANSAQVAILIDDGLRSSFGNQLTDVAAFVNALPPGMQVLIGYMRNGEVDVASPNGGFSTDHAAVADALRLPLSSAGISASPYFCLSEFVKHWPSNQPGTRFVLMLTNGVDPYNGSTSPLNQDSPYVQTAQEDAQRAGVAVYAIAYADAGFRGVRGAGNSGQNYLSQVAQATGGDSLWQGVGNPVSLQPFLKEFSKDISESYTISFMAPTAREKGDTLARLKLKTSQPGIKIHAPDGVHPGTNLQ